MRRRRGISRLAAVAIAVVVVAIVATAAWLLMPKPTPARDVIRVAIGIDLDTVDPHGQTTTLVYNVMRHVYETLVWVDGEGNVIPWLATSWEVSPDGLVWTFKLRKGVMFHDGTELDAYTVKANVDRWINPKVKVPTRSQLGPIKGAEVVDKYTVRIILERPYGPFLRALANYLLITSKAAIEKVNVTGTITEPVGTGPFVFKKWEKGKLIVLEAFDRYWGEKPKVKRIEWRIIPEASTREAALLAGDVDVAFLPPPADIEALKKNPNVVVLTPVTNRIIFVPLNPRGPLADPRVRQALNYAIDKEAIVKEVLFGLGVVADSPVPPHFFGYAKMTPYEYDPEKARRLLAEAGYPNGFKMILLHPTGRYLQDKQVAEAIQAYLREVGIEVELRTMDWPSFVRALIRPLEEKDYDAVLIGWGPAVADAHFTLYPQYHSAEQTPHGLGLTHYNNSVVDELLTKAMTEIDEGVRKDLYREAIEIIWRDAVCIWLYTQCNFIAHVKDLKDVWVHPGGEMIFFFYAYFESA